MVGAAIDNGVPEPIEVPPQLTVYQFKVPPDPPVAVSIMLPPVLLHIVGVFAEAEAGLVGTGVTLIVVVTQLELPQPPLASHLTK